MRTKWLIMILMMVCMVQIVTAAGETFQISTDNSTWVSITDAQYAGVVTAGDNLATIQLLDAGTKYYIRGLDDETSWKYIETRTESGGLDEMELSITIFILIVTGAIFYLAFTKELSRHKYLNFILKRSLIVLGLFLMTLNSAIMATMVAASGLPLTTEMFMFMQIFGWAGYVAIIVLLFTSIVQIFNQYKQDKYEREVE